MLVHDRPERHGRGGRRSWPGKRSRPELNLGCGRPVGQRGVWAKGVIVPAPALDDDLGFLERIEDLAVEQLVPELPLSRRSTGSPPPPSGPALSAPQLGAASRRSPQACAASSTSIRPPSALASHTSGRTTSQGADQCLLELPASCPADDSGGRLNKPQCTVFGRPR